MNEPLTLILAGVAGLFLGAIFFGGLWWTVRKGVTSSRPAFWFLGSLLLRMVVVLAGFYFAGGSQWQRWLGCLLGFFVGRFLVLWLTRPPVALHSPTTKEVSRAP